MGLYLDLSNSDYSAKGIAQQNRLNGVTGHTALGSILANLGPSIFTGILETIENSSKSNTYNNTSSSEETEKTLEYGQQQKKYNNAYMKYKAEPNNANALALKKAFENVDEKFNGYSRIKSQYKNIESDVEKNIKKS